MEFDQDAYDRFEAAIERRLGDRVRSEDSCCVLLYGSVTNLEWHHLDGASVGYSFRKAGTLISHIARRGSCLDWYCSGPEGQPADEIVAALGAEGWRPELL